MGKIIQKWFILCWKVRVWFSLLWNSQNSPHKHARSVWGICIFVYCVRITCCWAVHLLFEKMSDRLQRIQETPPKEWDSKTLCVITHTHSQLYTFLAKTPHETGSLMQPCPTMVKWALRTKGSSNNFKSYVMAIASTNQWDGPTHKTMCSSLQFHSWQQRLHRAAVLLYVPVISPRTQEEGMKPTS